MKLSFFKDYTPKFSDEELERLGSYFETARLYQRGMSFIAFLYLYEKGIWIK